MKNVYDFNDYREFLKFMLPTDGEQRGIRTKLADALNCQKGFISQVLSGPSHLSLEHAIKVSRFLKLEAADEEYFLLLVHLGKAGSKDLEEFYKKRMAEIIERRKEIKERIKAKSDLTEAEQMTYYSSWHYTAIHMCLYSSDLRKKGLIANSLGISDSVVSRVLDFLVNTGLAKEDGDEYAAGPARIHLPKSSPLVSKHHSNWRMRAIDSFDSPRENDLHYSLVMSISDEAAEKIKEVLLKTIQEVEPILKAAEDKCVYTLNMDLFALSKK